MTRNIRLYITVIFIGAVVMASLTLNAQIVKIADSISKRSFTYAIKGTDTLGLDVYTKETGNSIRPCVIFVFGGAFIAGHRDDSVYNNYFNLLTGHNYTVVSVSYRLGLKHVKHLSKLNTKPLHNAVAMAIEDVYDATSWVVKNSSLLNVDTSRIILSGSSSGAITILSAEFNRSNHFAIASHLPPGFRYAGLISFSGAVLSFNGKLRYAEKPAPALLFHGTGDKIVPYGKIRFFNKGFYGSSWIAKTYKQEGNSFFIYRATNLGHEVAIRPMYYQQEEILSFLDKYIGNRALLQTDTEINDTSLKPLMTMTPGELFKKLQQANKTTP